MAATTFGTPSKLLGSPINIAALRDDARTELEAILTKLPGQICLVVDPRLIPALKLIIVEGSKYMKEHKVDNILELSTASMNAECDTVLYLTRPSLALTELIAAQVKSFARRGIRRHLHVAFVPRRAFICEQLLKSEGVTEELTIHEYGLDMIPLDDDVMTLGLDTAFVDATVKGDPSPLLTVARALHKLQTVYGPVPSIRAKGTLAKSVLDLLLRMSREEDGVSEGPTRGGGEGKEGRRELINMSVMVGPKPGSGASTSSGGGGPPPPPPKPEIDMMIILDRSVDLVSALVTPLTTEALLQEQLGIDFGMAPVDMAILAPEGGEGEEEAGKPAQPKYAPGAKGTMHVNSNDKMYGEVRDLNVQAAGPHLTSRAKELQSFREQIKASKSMGVSDIHAFVKAIPTLQSDSKSLRILVDLLSAVQKVTNSEEFVQRWSVERGLIDEEGLKEALEGASAAIAKRAPLLATLRLLCLQSVIEGGLKGKVFEGVRRELLGSYGYELLPSLVTLERTGLLCGRESGGVGARLGSGLGLLASGNSGWSTVRRVLQLTSPSVDVDTPTDIHYVTSGYAPVSVRLVQAAVAGIPPPPGAPATAVTPPPGWEAIAEALRILPGLSVQVTQSRRGGGVEAPDHGEGGGRKVCLVVFVGGATHIELAGLRFLSEKSECGPPPSLLLHQLTHAPPCAQTPSTS
jgi:hypothetical protein